MSRIIGNTVGTPISPAGIARRLMYYTTSREELGVDGLDAVNVDYIRGMYKALIEKYPDNVRECAVYNDDGNFTNYEYVITTRGYSTTRKQDNLHVDDVKKPKYLILSGIHGVEKNAIISTYRFIRDVLSGHNVPSHFREGVEIHVLPTGTPYAIDASERLNGNSVNINRNFDWDFVAGGENGSSAASEKETQAIVNWLKANADAELFLDMHNSKEIYEATMLIGLDNNATVDRAKKTALRGIDRIIPYWRDVIGYKAQDMSADESGDMRDKVFSYAATVDSAGLCCEYAAGVLGIPSLVLELSSLQQGSKKAYSEGEGIFEPETVAAGAEAIGNILFEFYESNCAELADGTWYYSTLSGAVSDVNKGKIGMTADADKDTAVASVHMGNGQPCVTLLKNTVESVKTSCETDMTLNLNGYTLSVINNASGIDVASKNVTIDGRLSGSGVNVYSNAKMAIAIQIKTGNGATIKGGKYLANNSLYAGSDASAYAISVNKDCTAVISGCELTVESQVTTIGLAIKSSTVIANTKIGVASSRVAMGVYINGANDISVYMDNCEFNVTGNTETTAIGLSGGGTTNNKLHISNSKIPENAAISIGDATHKLYVGLGNNFTADDTNLPANVTAGTDVYVR